MVFGGPLLKKKVKSSVKVEISPKLLIDALEPLLRTLNYVKPAETISTITFHLTEGKSSDTLLPITIKKEVLKLSNATPESSQRG